MEEDYYKVLGCHRTASPEEIKKLYKDKAKRLHPDKGGDPEEFKKLNAAYSVLGDPELRSRYDQFGSKGIEGVDFSSHEGFPDIFEMFGGHFPFRRPRDPSSDRRTRDRRMDLEVAMEEMYHGATVKFRFRRKIFIGDPSTGRCDACDGRGKIVERMKTSMGLLQNIRMCSVCAGMGVRVHENQFKSHAEVVDVLVPPHSYVGHEIVMPKKADEMPGMDTGNLVLTLILKKHPIFHLLQHHHLLWEVEVHPLEAMTQFVRTVRLPSGEDLSIHHVKKGPFFSVLDKWRVIPLKGLYNPHRERGHVFISFRLKEYSVADTSKALPFDQFLPREPSYNSIPISALDLHDMIPLSSSNESAPPQNPFQGQPPPQPQECRPS